MENISFKCEIVTPMFLGGPDGNTAELRPPSIKGVLRFWWRALNGHMSLEDLRKKEAVIFGGASDMIADSYEGRKIGRSRVTLSVENISVKVGKVNLTEKKTPGINTNQQVYIFTYLTYGTQNSCLKENGRFHVNLYFDNGLNEKETKSVINAFVAMSKYGGLGAKSRNGFGSFDIVESKGFPVDIENINIKLFNQKQNYRSFHKDSRLFLSDSEEKWEDAAAKIGIAYYRSKLSLEGKHQYNKRKFVALPVGKLKRDRNAKPYFLSVSKENGKYIGRILFLASKYYKPNEDNNYQEVCNAFNQTLLKHGLKQSEIR